MNRARPNRFGLGLLLGAILLGAAGLFFWRSQSPGTSQPEFQTMTVSRGPLNVSVGATGTVRAAQSAVLVWQTSGRVESVNAKIGDKVSADQTLASLAQSSLPQEIVLAEAERVSAQQNLDNLEKSDLVLAQALQDLAKAKQAVKDAQDKLDFYERTAQGRAPQELLDDYVDKIEAAQDQVKFLEWIGNKYYKNTGDDLRRKAEYNLNLTNSRQNVQDLIAMYNWFSGRPSEILMEQTRAALSLAIAKQEDAQREVDRLDNGKNVDDLNAAKAKLAAAQATLNLAKIIAPFEGTITQADPQAGDRVATNQQAFQLDDLSTLLIDLEISEVDINNVALGQPVTITFDAVQEKSYTGVVTSVDLSGDKNQGAVDFAVTVTLLDADELVKPGMTAAATIVVKDAEDVLLVPNRAVRMLNGQQVVYVLKAGQPVAVQISLGASAEANSEVTGGDLLEGDQLILNPSAIAATPQGE